MKSKEIRAAFLSYFERQGHKVEASSSLVPGNDPTLLFTNAGMVQFKDVFLGQDKRPYNRATSSQRCVRAGGKHNDLENVGYTARHHTFFEMLGNFSFGDYFKREAIQFAWEFLTKEMNLPEEKLWVTVYKDDQEAEEIWLKEMGVSAERFSRLGDKDNFWSMGDTGPCGPCTEIFFDHGENVEGGPPGSPEEDGDRYIEIWNLVFMQYDRQNSGELVPLPKPSVDTGMGLERIAAVMQGVHSNYEIDLFQGLLQAAAKETGQSDTAPVSLRVIADHIRSCAFLVADGVIPSNEGRGYVLRRIIRRALRHGHKLGQSEPFFHKLVASLAAEMGDAYPELLSKQSQIEKVLLAEEEQFAKTLDAGMKVLTHDLQGLEAQVIPGDVLFKLYDTYGFPVDLTGDIAREKGLDVDMVGFEVEMNRQRERARAAKSFVVDYSDSLQLDGQTNFTGYDQLQGASSVTQLIVDGELVERASAGQQVAVILSETPFYAESGGQVGDQGALAWSGGTLIVQDVQKKADLVLHLGTLDEGALSVGDLVETHVDESARRATALNHSATHLAHAALQQVLGDHVAQKGSLVNPQRLRFDFTHFEAMTADQVSEVEEIVNTQIRSNSLVSTKVMSVDDAKESGAKALFGEKYGDKVRVLSMGQDDFSVELCGGTHAERCGDIGFFKVVAETGIAAGVRRVEGVTGGGASAWAQHTSATLGEVSSLMKVSAEQVVEKIKQTLDKNKTLEKEIERLKAKLASSTGSDLSASAQDIGGVMVLAARLDDADSKALRGTVDQLKNKLGSGVILLAAVKDEKAVLISGVTKDLTDKYHAGQLLSHVAAQMGGKGGGRADMAQGGANDLSNLDAALASVTEWVATQ
ncbi:MAG: alanine--tRNA ligase [Gammaproteobacteria bacterium]|nr:alanine--tRNA ligase [Gammaproteobacteria bacterium]